MLTKVDWLSFSFPCEFPEGLPLSHVVDRMRFYLNEEFKHDLLHEFFPPLTLTDKGRAPYNLSFRDSYNRFVIFFSTTLKHALVEITGQGCDFVRDHQMLEILLDATKHRATRLDVASDFLCDTDPIDFAAKRIPGHFRAHSEFVSESGSTAYIGSRTSDRYARVYRYNPPHERAHLLRVEYVFKGETAKLTIAALIESSPAAVSKAAGEAFGWQHPAYQPEAPEAAVLSVWRPERHQGKTLFWLNDTVAPLLIRLQREGVLDATAWLRDNVLNRLSSNDGL